MQRNRAQTNTSGVLTWTFPVPFTATPIIQITVEDVGGTGNIWNHSISAISTTAVTIQLTKTVDTTVLGIHLLGISATPQAYVHVSAVAP